MEEDVYNCKWKKSGDGYRLWLKGKPNVAVEGSDNIDVLSEQLSQRITESGGAQHAVLEFDKPFPKSAFDQKYRSPELVTVCGGNNSFESTLTAEQRHSRWLWYDQYFDQPSCTRCHAVTTPRNERPIAVDHFNASSDGGFVTVRPTALYVFSDDFLNQLTSEERSGLELQPVTLRKRSRKEFYEVVGPSQIPFVSLHSVTPTGWQCGQCNCSVFGHMLSPQTSIDSFVAASDLPTDLPGVFVVGIAPQLKLCMTADRWAEIRPCTKKLTSSPLGVVPDNEVVRKPILEVR